MTTLAFTLAAGTTLYLDPYGKTSLTLDGNTPATISGADSKQQLAELMIRFPANFALNAANLEYSVGDNLQKFGANAVPRDVGSASPSASTSPSSSLSPSASASPSASGSRSPSASASPSVSVSLSPSASASPSVSVSLSPSASASPSASVSLSPSASVSRSPSASPSAS